MRRTIRIEITDVSDEDADLFYGPKHRETATLVREFVLGEYGTASPAQLIEAMCAWLDRPEPPADKPFDKAFADCPAAHCDLRSGHPGPCRIGADL